MATAASTTIDGSAAMRKRVEPYVSSAGEHDHGQGDEQDGERLAAPAQQPGTRDREQGQQPEQPYAEPLRPRGPALAGLVDAHLRGPEDVVQAADARGDDQRHPAGVVAQVLHPATAVLARLLRLVAGRRLPVQGKSHSPMIGP